MSDRRALRYFSYDGSFEGFLCCVFEAFLRRITPASIQPEDAGQPGLFPPEFIPTDETRARRVLRSIPQKISPEALGWVRDGFLTCAEDKELLLLKFLQKGFKAGPKITNMLWDETVDALSKALRHMYNENHLLLGFTRFQERSGILTATISPKNCVLPLMAPHFSARFPREAFVIYDDVHEMILLHQKGECRILPVEGFAFSEADAGEGELEALWKTFYDTIAIKERKNPLCRMGHMPKRYWKNMTEMCTAELREAGLPESFKKEKKRLPEREGPAGELPQ